MIIYQRLTLIYLFFDIELCIYSSIDLQSSVLKTQLIFFAVLQTHYSFSYFIDNSFASINKVMAFCIVFPIHNCILFDFPLLNSFSVKIKIKTLPTIVRMFAIIFSGEFEILAEVLFTSLAWGGVDLLRQKKNEYATD